MRGGMATPSSRVDSKLVAEEAKLNEASFARAACDAKLSEENSPRPDVNDPAMDLSPMDMASAMIKVASSEASAALEVPPKINKL